MAFPQASVGKSWTSTASGWPVGCHSRPAFLNWPTNSFFFVSTEITGCLRRRNRTAVALMYSNWALRSRVRGALTPLLRGLQAVAQLPEEAAQVVELTRHPTVSAAASFARLLHVHRSGDVGSPRVRGSTSASRAAVMPGCVVWMRGRPAPVGAGAPPVPRRARFHRAPSESSHAPGRVADDTTDVTRHTQWPAIPSRPTRVDLAVQLGRSP